ncbi:MAG: response regulator [Myxococcales bacterium]|nr:response regulator [Myxococcales bacterium]
MSKLILVVDDDPDIARLYAMALGTLGEVVTVQTGSDALIALSERSFDAVILDLFMPVVSGFDVMDNLARGDHPNHSTPVFIVTADQSETTRARVMRRGAIFQLTKPVPLRVLVDQVRTQLERRSQRSRRGTG